MDLFDFKDGAKVAKRRKTTVSIESLICKQTFEFGYEFENVKSCLESKTPQNNTFSWKDFEEVKPKQARNINKSITCNILMHLQVFLLFLVQ